MRPIWSDLEHTRDATGLWQRSQRRFVTNVVGPHFEQICRDRTRHMAPPELFGDYPSRVSEGTVNDPTTRSTHQVDVVVFGLDEENRSRLLAIGEAKWNETMGVGHVERLRRIRALLVGRGRTGDGHARLACYSGGGFTPELIELAARSDDVALIGLDFLYDGPGRLWPYRWVGRRGPTIPSMPVGDCAR